MMLYKQPMRWCFLYMLILLSSCRAYKQDIMFRLDEDFSAADLAIPVRQAESNYQLLPNDWIQLDVFTNKGERIIDPNFELVTPNNVQGMRARQDPQYLIQIDSIVKLPIVGRVKLAGFTVDEAEAILEQAYDSYYKESFVKLQVVNRRVIVLGANGGQVIPITNENTSLVEVLALYGGLNLGAKAHNIKLIRGNLSNPEVYMINLATIDGMQSTIVQVAAGDIIYVEPWRRPWLASLRDVSPLLSLASSMLTLIVVIQNLAN